MTKSTLGIIMIVKNEIQNLPKSLAKVAGCFDEAVVIDTGSSDGTPELAESLGAKVYRHVWKHDFAEARNVSISKANADWLFWLDADNAISPQDVHALRKVIPQNGPAIIWAREKVVPGGEKLWQKRCFPNHPSVRFKGRVHEQLMHPIKWPSLASPAIIAHWGYTDAQKVADKGAYYLGLLEQMIEEDSSDYYARFQAARCLKNLRRFDQAGYQLEMVINSEAARRLNNDIWLHAHLMSAEISKLSGDLKGAFQLLKKLTENGQKSGYLLYRLARLAMDMADYDSAQQYFKTSLKLGVSEGMVEVNPSKVRFFTYYYLAGIQRRKGMASQAVEYYRQALGIQNDNLGARVELGRLLISLNRFKEAESEINLLLEQNPENRTAIRLLSRIKEAA